MTGMETFIVRVWVPDGGSAIPSTLRGVVLHVASGETATFVGEKALLAFLVTLATVDAAHCAARAISQPLTSP